MRCLITVTAICLALTVSFARAENCASPAFAVNGLHLDTQAADGTLARRAALEKATTDAFEILKRRLLLPDQATGVLDTLPFSDFVNFVHIDAETALAQRYIADIDICFDAIRLRDQFVQIGLNWSELFSPPVLLLPVWEDPSGTKVWARNVPWLNIWRQVENQNDQLLRFVLLYPDLALERRLSPERIRDRKADVLTLSAQSASAQQITWLYAGIDYSRDVPKLIMKADLFDVDGRFLSQIQSTEMDVNERTSLSDVFAEFRHELLTTLSDTWQRKNLYKIEDMSAIHIKIPADNLQDWYRLRQMLSDLPIVQSLTVLQLAPAAGIVKLKLSGSVETLKMALRPTGHGLEVDASVYRLTDRTD